MARLSNSTLRTVRFYEEEGLLQPLERSDGGHRLFPESELDKLRLVSELRLIGLSLEEIKSLLHAKRQSGSGADAARELDARLGQCAAVLDQRIALLGRLRAEIEAARRAIQRCETCTHNHLFPESCGECRIMKDAGDLPPAATVLWGLKR
jgi:DNA-binding transcriptional MerR regulator